MPKRDVLADLIAIKERSGRRGGRIPDDRDLQRLREIWEQWTGPKETLAELLPARLVTLVEMFCRRWVQKLIDYGAPYDERATDLKVEIKFDLALVACMLNLSAWVFCFPTACLLPASPELQASLTFYSITISSLGSHGCGRGRKGSTKAMRAPLPY